ncbi:MULTISPECIES: pilus assembly protein PilP [Halomonadaceae]|uniref:pilus assembly protein PilP n=1 Tax=Halomonadaceae TaxID=28256 RepID=UPI00159A7D75|nr:MULTISPECIES: pilus assembly protein PilP [Halomonas]QJQ95075.1 pilus assembly protein PilP [Halomonas sp. PA5]
MRPARCLGSLLVILGMAGCADPDIAGLDRELDALRRNPGELVVPALPEVPSYQSLSYDQGDQRSPFISRLPADNPAAVSDGLAPDLQRPREPLEEYSLEALTLVGILTVANQPSALIKAPGGQVHRLRIGNHLGADNGRIVAITHHSVQLVELVNDARGGWMERTQQLALTQEHDRRR